MSTAPVVKIAATGAATATHTTASYTPEANSRELAFISGYKATASPALPTITDTAGNTWTLLADYTISTTSNPNIRSAWYISDDTGSSPASRTATVAATGGGQIGVIICDVLSVDTDGTLAQAAVFGEDLSTGDPSCTFGSTPGASNITLLGASFGGGSTATKPASFASIANAVTSTARITAASYDITSASIGPNAYTSLNPRAIIIGIELNPAAAGGAMVGSSTLSFTPSGVMAGDGVLIGSSSLAFTPSSTLAGSGVLAGSSSLAFTTSGTSLAIAALVGSSSLTYASSGTLLGDGVLAGSSTLTFSPTGVLTGDGALVASSDITFTLSGTLANLTSPGAMIGTSSLTFTPVGVLTGTGALVASSSLTFALTGDMSPSLIGATSITFTTTGTLSGLQSPYGLSSGTSPDGLYQSDSGDGSFLYYETSGSSPDNPYEEN